MTYKNEMTPKSLREGIIMIPNLKLRSLFYMNVIFKNRLNISKITVLIYKKDLTAMLGSNDE